MIRNRGVVRRPVDWQRSLYLPLTILAWLAVLGVAGWLLQHVTKTLLMLSFSAIVAFALTPLVKFLSRRMPRGPAVALAFILGFGIILGMGALLIYTAAEQVKSLVDNLPAYSHRLQKYEPQVVRALHPFGVTHAKVQQAQNQAVNALQSAGTTAAKDSLGIISHILGTLVDIILVLILSVYLTVDGARFAEWLRRQGPTRQRRQTGILFSIVNRVVGGYIRGTLTLALLIGFLVGAGMLVLRVPYAVLLGVLAFFMEFIPVVGVLVSGAICAGVALTKGWVLMLIVLAYFVLIHVIEGDVVGPRIMGKAVGIHPATAIIALAAGTELFGIWGALFASPVAGLLQAIGTAVFQELRAGDGKLEVKDVVDDVDRELNPSPTPQPDPPGDGTTRSSARPIHRE